MCFSATADGTKRDLREKQKAAYLAAFSSLDHKAIVTPKMEQRTSVVYLRFTIHHSLI
jgi:hypothetical protein